ncbi:hypothetical protein SAMN05443428_102150 [Caloramator quimbayensis]|uniref:Transposase n=1 Tax=Caloramator quimbayensis TaxID=1147123 RepID=A0A1T4WMW4_9CLOT|nr:hypothetical protein SAMN05443428_102150 [Caloramator quimbayensis]
MKAILNICCGLDIHKESIVACILKGMPDEDVTVIR